MGGSGAGCAGGFGGDGVGGMAGAAHSSVSACNGVVGVSRSEGSSAGSAHSALWSGVLAAGVSIGVRVCLGCVGLASSSFSPLVIAASIAVFIDIGGGALVVGTVRLLVAVVSSAFGVAGADLASGVVVGVWGGVCAGASAAFASATIFSQFTSISAWCSR